MTEPVLRFRDVAFAYDPARPVLAGASFELAPGERVGLTGPNGAGKSTLLHLAVGLERPAAGEVEVFGAVRHSEEDFADVRGRAGLLFQDADDQLFCPTVLEDVAFGPLNLGADGHGAAERAEAALERLGILPLRDRITLHLSGGEKRLVSLAGVLAMEPEILLLDEPTGGVDETTEAALIEILTRLPQAMIVVSHERPFLEAVATREVRLADGVISPAEGKPDRRVASGLTDRPGRAE